MITEPTSMQPVPRPRRSRGAAALLAASVVLAAALLVVAAAAGLDGCHDSASGCVRSGDRPEELSAPTPLAADFQRGVNHAHIHSRGHGYGSAVSAAALDSLRRIGINAIAVTPFAFQPGHLADHVFGYPDDGAQQRRHDPSMTAEDIATEIANAHRRGISVVLKPHIWSNDFWNGGEWHGTIDQATPAAHASWWASYRAFSLFWAGVAERAGADRYCIGTELVRMTTRYPDEWRGLIRDIRGVYHGRLVYAAHWEHEFDSISFWDALDEIGINAYFPLDVSDSATVGQLVAAWKPHVDRIGRLAARFNKPVVFLEAGYRPSTTAFRQPWAYSGGAEDLGAQSRAYEALFRACASEPWWHGVYFWKTFTDPAAAASWGEEMDFCFQGRPAENVVRTWFAGR